MFNIKLDLVESMTGHSCGIQDLSNTFLVLR